MLLLLLSAAAHHCSATTVSLGLQEANVLPATPRVSGTRTEIIALIRTEGVQMSDLQIL